MLPTRFTRREFLTRSAAAAAGLYVASCSGTPPPRPTFGRDILKVDTQWPIKRVVYLMLENRSFDNIFGRFPGADGARTGIRDGAAVPLTHCPEWMAGDIPHDRAAFENSWKGGAMDGFALGALGPYYAYWLRSGRIAARGQLHPLHRLQHAVPDVENARAVLRGRIGRQRERRPVQAAHEKDEFVELPAQRDVPAFPGHERKDSAPPARVNQRQADQHERELERHGRGRDEHRAHDERGARQRQADARRPPQSSHHAMHLARMCMSVRGPPPMRSRSLARSHAPRSTCTPGSCRTDRARDSSAGSPRPRRTRTA